MSKSLSFGEAIVATAEQKRDTASARSSPVAADRPRDVILRACEAIADQLREDGFSFVKSGLAVGIRPAPDPEWPAPDREICRPILPPIRQSRR
jgi:hypothetical protein